MNTAHPVTLFTGQWADMPFEDVARLAAEWGYDGLEIAASGDHLDLKRADEDPAYLQSRLEILDRYGLKAWAISNHLAGQAVCDDPIDFRHQGILRDYVWGDGEGEGVRQRAAEDMALGTRRMQTRCRRGGRLHRLENLAARRDVPAGFGRSHRCRLRGIRQALASDHGRIR